MFLHWSFNSSSKDNVIFNSLHFRPPRLTMTMWVLSFLPGKTRGLHKYNWIEWCHDFFLQPNINDPEKFLKALVTASLVWFGLLPMPWPGHLGFFHYWGCWCCWWCSVAWDGYHDDDRQCNDDAVGLWLLDENIARIANAVQVTIWL